MTRLVLATLCAALLIPATLLAEDAASDTSFRRTAAQQDEQNRAYLLARLVALSKDESREQVQARVDRMTPRQVQLLVEAIDRRDHDEAQAIEAREARAEDPAYRAEQVAAYRQQLDAAHGAGFAPVIGWLPDGASLGASAVVSPDRRYVRVSAAPLFSNVGPVNTFRFAQPVAPTQFINGRPVVGYQRVIGWLPSGTSLGVGAVVSPDRRYVRVSAAPFFSQVGPVRTFNFRTGKSRVVRP